MFKVWHDDNNVIIVANARLHTNDIGLTTAKQFIDFTAY